MSRLVHGLRRLAAGSVSPEVADAVMLGAALAWLVALTLLLSAGYRP